MLCILDMPLELFRTLVETFVGDFGLRNSIKLRQVNSESLHEAGIEILLLNIVVRIVQRRGPPRVRDPAGIPSLSVLYLQRLQGTPQP